MEKEENSSVNNRNLSLCWDMEIDINRVNDMKRELKSIKNSLMEYI